MDQPTIRISEEVIADRCARLNDRQRIYLRYTTENRKSKEIAILDGVSSRSVDKALAEATKILGVTNRFEAARLFAAYEREGRNFPLQSSSLDEPASPRLAWPVPTRRMPVNLLKAREVLIWGVIIMIATPIGLAVAAMLIHSLMILFGAKLT